MKTRKKAKPIFDLPPLETLEAKSHKCEPQYIRMSEKLYDDVQALKDHHGIKNQSKLLRFLIEFAVSFYRRQVGNSPTLNPVTRQKILQFQAASGIDSGDLIQYLVEDACLKTASLKD